MNLCLRPSRFRTVLAAALLGSLVQVAISCKDKAQPAKMGAASASSDLVYVITLHGTVGSIPGESAKAFTAESLKVSLDAAKRAKATVVVLDIDGPGGQVLEMQHMVKVLLEAQVGGMRIVALPRDAFSAWSIVALSCKEILVTPTSRVGAAVSITSNGKGFIEAVEGKDSVSQKFAAPFQALWRQITDVTGRPPCIADAMRIQTAELWYSPTKGFAETSGTETDWQQLDDGVHVLCLTGAEMRKTKMAIGEVRNQSDLPTLLNCVAETQIRMNFPPLVTTQTNTTLLAANLYEEVFQVVQIELEKTWAICGDKSSLYSLLMPSTVVRTFYPRITVSDYERFNVPGVWTTKVSDSDFIQVTGIAGRILIKSLSKADILNDVEWFGTVEFTAEAKRVFTADEGRYMFFFESSTKEDNELKWTSWWNIEDGIYDTYWSMNLIKQAGEWRGSANKIIPKSKVFEYTPYSKGIAPDCESIPVSNTPPITPLVDQHPDHDTPSTPPTIIRNIDPKTPPPSPDN